MTDEKIINEIKTRPFKLWDIALVLSLIILSFLPVIFTVSAESEAKSVQITQNGVSETFLLTEEKRIEMDELTVVISGGQVWVENAKCPDKVCEHSGKIQNAGESIVCLPNGVIVKIIGKSDFDASTGEVK